MRKPHARTYVKEIPAHAVPVPEFPKHFITREGQIFSAYGRPKLRGFSLNESGYPICVMIHESGKTKACFVHILVARLFVAGWAEGLEVNHKDMVKTNCVADNLEWMTHAENIRLAHAALPEWRKATGKRVSRPLIATDKDTGERMRFESGKAAALHIGRADAAGNISKAVRHGRPAYGFYWSKAKRRP